MKFEYMNAKRRINKNHPDYTQYIEKCLELGERFHNEENAVLANYPEWRGQDHPASAEIYQIKMRFHKALDDLRNEYAYLFS